MDDLIPIIDICGKKTLEYICDCLGLFNRGVKKICVRSIGGNILKGVQIAQILKKEFGIRVEGSNIETVQFRFDDNEQPSVFNSSCEKIILRNDLEQKKLDLYNYGYPKSEFVDFPIYHLLLDYQLARNKELKILRYDGTPLVTMVDQGTKVKFKRNVDFKKEIERDDEEERQDNRIFYGIRNVFYRSGLLLPKEWRKIAKKLSEFDDIIIGIDTNILYNCSLSEYLISSLSLIDLKEYSHTPNWVLFIIPSAVMHEIEESANIRDKRGFLKYEGRMGFRALQEIIELSQCTDMPGISLMIVGETNPILDTRVELQGLREDIWKREISEEKDISRNKKKLHMTRSMKSSSGDMIIRDQFKEFLRQINFHKGTYFLTADKSNVALARTEGLHPIYFPLSFGFYLNNPEISFYKINTKGGETIEFRVPIGKLIYEMAVEFGNIRVKFGDKEIKIRCDSRGETLDYWICRSLRIKQEDFNKLLSEEFIGIFDLNIVANTWKKLINRLVGLEEIG